MMFAFLLTPLREGRRGAAGAARRDLDFYSRPCGRGDRGLHSCGPHNCNFYSRPCGRGDLFSASLRRCIALNFYSRPCGRGDLTQSKFADRIHLFLLTPLREGRRQTFPYHQYLGFISTHAPAGGATRLDLDGRTGIDISTHAPAGGATCHSPRQTHPVLFLLTPLREGRPITSAS